MDHPGAGESPWAFIEYSQDIIVVIDENGEITYVNSAVEAVLGYRPSELVDVNVFNLIHPEDRDELWERFVSLIEQKSDATDRVQHRMVGKDDQIVWVESIGSNQRHTDLDGYVINSRDITDAKERQQELEEYKEFTEAIFDSIEDGFFIMDSSADIIRWNHTVTEVTGYTDADVESMSAVDFVPEEQHGVIAENLLEALETGDARFEADLQAKDGSRTAYEFRASRLENPDGETVFAGIGRDISERNQREQQLRRFRRAIQASGHAIYLTDTDGRIEFVNPAFEDITGYSAEEALGSTPGILRSGEMPDEYYEALWATVMDGQVWEEEVVNCRKDGELYSARQTIAPIQGPSNENDGFVAIQTDVSEEKDRIERLVTYRQAIESAQELIAAVDSDYQYIFANRAYLEYHDITQVAIERTSLKDALGDEIWQEVKPLVDRALDGELVRYQMNRSSNRGKDRYLDIEYYPIGEPDSDEIVGVGASMRDITEIRERQRQLVIISRILRHNLHNDMNVIRGYAELIHEESTGDIAESAEKIISESNRLLETVDKTKVVTDLFAEDHHRTEIDLEARIELIIRDLRRDYPAVDIKHEFADVEPIRASNQIGLAVRELLRNAAEYNDSESPEVTIETDVTAHSVTVEVSDNGPGIPEMERRVLTEVDYEEPLYHGSGLGMWLVYWVVQRSEGVLSFRHNEPRGSVVRIELPRR